LLSNAKSCHCFFFLNKDFRRLTLIRANFLNYAIKIEEKGFPPPSPLFYYEIPAIKNSTETVLLLHFLCKEIMDIMFTCFFFVSFFILSCWSFTWPVREWQPPKACKDQQAFDITAFQCFDCGQDSLPTQDGKNDELLQS